MLNQTDNFFQHVIVLDEYAMNHLIALTNLNPQLPVQAPTENSFIHPWDDPQRSHEMQHNILETLCAPPQHILNYDNFLLGFTIIPAHLKTNLSNELIVESWFTKINLVTPPPTISCSIYP